MPEDEETRDKIIRATNSQTPIPKASLRATDQVHRQIEEYLKTRNLFYDRRKNFYKNEGKKPQEIISVPFLSQCLMAVLMQKPNYARARPSTLLEDDESYDKLFHKNNVLKTYYLLALWGRLIELKIKNSKRFVATEITDIKFYVLYAAVCLLNNNLYPNNNSVSALDASQLDDSLILASIDLVYDLYKEHGGTDKVAKGSSLTDALKTKLRSTLGARSSR